MMLLVILVILNKMPIALQEQTTSSVCRLLDIRDLVELKMRPA